MAGLGIDRPGFVQTLAASTNPFRQSDNNPYSRAPGSAASSNDGLLPPTRGSSNSSRQALLGRQASFDGPTYSSASLTSPTADEVARGAVGFGYGPYSPSLSVDHSIDDDYDDRDSINEFSNSSKYNLADPTPDDYWNEKDDLQDKLHSLNYKDTIRDNRACSVLSLRGWLNIIGLLMITASLVGLFAGYPLFDYISKLANRHSSYGWNLGATNATGQVPEIANFPSLIDNETPQDRRAYTGYDGQPYELVFSDEFNTAGRTFYPGDDPFWTAVNLHYWGTNDLEWYDPEAATTEDGNLVITMTQETQHGLDYKSAMLQSWNQFCFTGGYIEINVSLPGASDISGLWPGAWTMGNLGRAGYGATTDGTWPYSYESCDVGTLPNQTYVNGTGPLAALSGGDIYNGGTLSYQPGQKLSSCTCRGEDHPGPTTGTGRGTPEIDIFEAEVAWDKNTRSLRGAVSQSAQIAPFDIGYEWNNDSSATTNFSPDKTEYNTYLGGTYQEAISGVTYTDPTAYQLSGGNYATYGFEYWPGGSTDSHITWVASGQPTWKVTPLTFPPVPALEVGQRLVSMEPMYILLNLGMSSSFQRVNFAELQFPAKMLVDYVRVYQRTGQTNVGCSPKAYPTADYIQDHLNAYSDNNLTTWEAAGYAFPKSSLKDGC